jgi:hypothetical protein
MTLGCLPSLRSLVVSVWRKSCQRVCVIPSSKQAGRDGNALRFVPPKGCRCSKRISTRCQNPKHPFFQFFGHQQGAVAFLRFQRSNFSPVDAAGNVEHESVAPIGVYQCVVEVGFVQRSCFTNAQASLLKRQHQRRIWFRRDRHQSINLLLRDGTTGQATIRVCQLGSLMPMQGFFFIRSFLQAQPEFARASSGIVILMPFLSKMNSISLSCCQ